MDIIVYTSDMNQWMNNLLCYIIKESCNYNNNYTHYWPTIKSNLHLHYSTISICILYTHVLALVLYITLYCICTMSAIAL